MASRHRPQAPTTTALVIDRKSKSALSRAAALRGISVSDYVRTVAVAQAHREIRAARDRIIALTPEEQLAFCNALSKPAKLTASQRCLGAIMRGEA